MNEKGELLPLKGKELKCVEYLVGMESRIAESGDALRDRLRLIPNGWRNFRLIFATLDRLLTDLYDTLPLKKQAVPAEHHQGRRDPDPVHAGVQVTGVEADPGRRPGGDRQPGHGQRVCHLPEAGPGGKEVRAPESPGEHGTTP